MDAEIFAEWMRRQGHEVIRTASSYWYNAGPRVLQAFPYHWVIQPTQKELNQLMLSRGILALRYSTPVASSIGQISYHVIYENGPYELSALPKKARHDVTHGLRYASYGPISMSCLADEGWLLRKDTLKRQGRSRAETQAFWESVCYGAEGLPCFEAWGAIHQGRLVAALLACRIDDTIGILYQQSLTEHLKFGVSNTLTYTFTQDAIRRPGVCRVFYGLQSLDAPNSVDEFKFRMRYTSMPVRQRVVFHPTIEPFIQPVTHKLLKILHSSFSESTFLAKFEGLVRFYLRGKNSLSEQDWPNVLLEEKNEILAEAM